MALRPEEILRIKYQLGVSVTLIGAEPYITYLAVFDKAIQPYIIDPSTTSTTAVVAGTTQAITVAAIPLIVGTSTPAFVAGSYLTVDVGLAQEVVQAIVVTGTTVYGTFAFAHGANGLYTVAMAGGEQVVREILTRIATIETKMNSIAPNVAGVNQADEVSFHPSSTVASRRGTRDTFESLTQQREQARDDLGEAIGFANLRRLKRQSGMSSSPY
jgi:hypothetical protein